MPRKKTKGIGNKKELQYPCSSEKFSEIARIINELRNIEGEYLVVELSGYPKYLGFIQTTRDGDDWLLEIGLKLDNGDTQIFRLPKTEKEACVNIFQTVCVDGNVPDLTKWDDITDEIFPKTTEINIFKTAYKTVRENSTEIYKGFGFKHLSNATQYYVHPDNQSFEGTTTLCHH